MGLHVRSKVAAIASDVRSAPAVRVAGRIRRLPGVIAIVVLLLLACAPVGSAQPAPGAWDPLLPRLPSAGAPGDPVAIANASFQATAMATQTAMTMGRNFLSNLGIVGRVADPSTSVRGSRVNGAQAIEYVIRRAGTQIGVPYSWGGGSLTGPSLGVDRGASTVGFDCSGLTRFAFAGVGVLLPRWSGHQYDAGRKVPPSQAKRGDLLFWGPGGSQHEAIYLGGGQMIEAQQTGVPIKVSPVRTGGMTPYVVRIIES
ncbi:MAG: NlpC/P60 family peptidoglycan endopeptidase RipB [Actinomycetia bacterium]|nr:NlpC/P60 family peptidoglycan endopeptidase RipB [Actinomycetes bacterium]